MKKIIYVQNMVVSGQITVIALMTGFYELTGFKLFIVAVMGFIVLNYLILQVERMWLRHEKKRKAEGAGSAVQGIPWFKHKMRYLGTVKEDRDTRGNASEVQKRTRYNPILPSNRYR